jgi:PHD/YefM family antitoxin component YafN of YafNO toxin-antitoxin module
MIKNNKNLEINTYLNEAQQAPIRLERRDGTAYILISEKELKAMTGKIRSLKAKIKRAHKK